ncbi:hypothetical protein HDIA_3633 [Hartmannibacter diazotrophicus]|uniref:Uncharacterized protein n=1 Tax=Hartmannibacter diazotrophicus TaxID=1482074 RepID=A0A2C9DA22_9HYPH|nr:hypothetical protein [Hartmannibacter diazotrophicus]SON57174.1 hypothetical protein HDIA_3633 [Hartmannibacter diazotrophicus]
MDQFLKALNTRHDLLDAELQAERSRPAPDGERVMALKTMQRQVRSQIEYIERQGSQSAPLMVVRLKRSGSIQPKPYV